MPRKVFTAGEVLAAADVNEFLQDQAVMSFAGTAARGSAIPSPVEGMTTFLEDSNILSIYDGSAWKTSVGSVGGIVQVVQGESAVDAPVSTTSTSFVTSNCEATITPRSASNKILIIVSGDNLSASNGVFFVATVFRGGSGGTNIGGAGGFAQFFHSGSGSGGAGHSILLLDSPNTTSATTYTIMFRSSGGGSVSISRSRSSITLLEVAS
jgi:hypothetical protein